MAQLSRPSSPDNNTQHTTDAIDFSNARTEVALRAIRALQDGETFTPSIASALHLVLSAPNRVFYEY